MFLEELDIEIDMEQGFLESGGKMYAKAYTITLSMMNDSANLIRPYYMTGIPKDENYDIYAQTTSEKKFITDENAYLFPYNRKTSRIGGK
ncbi:MAG TPA: hypothetical protein DEG69_11470 [Flavobacteriaceae bacterium]|nr:hypothetical protein [Flavobacteriaceae bacterium]